MKLQSRMLPVITLPIIMIGMLQLGGCTRKEIPPAAPGGTYLSTSAGARFEQSVDIAKKEGEYIAQFKLKEIQRPSHKPNHIYIAAEEQGIVVSKDDGITWKVIETKLARTLDIVVLANDVLIVSGVDGNGQGYILRSLDEGKSWHTVFTIPVPKDDKGFEIIKGRDPIPSVLISIEADPFQGDRVYGGSSLGTIFVGEQSAKVWRTLYTMQKGSYSSSSNTAGAAVKLMPSPFIQGELLLITKDQRLLRIRDGEQIEMEIPENINTQSMSRGTRKVRDMAFIPQFPDALLIGTEEGIVATRDKGESWLDLGLPVEASQVFDTIVVAVSPTNPDRLLVAINNIIYRSEDGGGTWNTFSLGLPNHLIRDLSINPTNAGRVLLVAMPVSS